MKLYFLALLSAFFLVACGGGSSNGGSSSGGSASTSTANVLTVSSSSVSFNTQQFGDIPNNETRSVSWSDARVAALTVGFAPNAAQVDWLDVSSTDSLSPVTLTFGVNRTDVNVGSNATTIRVGATDTTGAVINFRDISISYNVAERPLIGIDGQSSYTFYAIADGSQTPTQTVQTVGDGVEWYSSVDQNWLYADTSANTAPADFGIAVNPQGLSAGQYTGTVTVTDSRVPSRSASVAVTAEIQSALTLSGASELEFNFVDGQSSVAAQSLSFTGADIDWSAIADEPWVTIDTASGNGNATLSVGVDTSTLSTGTHTSTLTISDTNDNFDQALEILITANVEPRMISAEKLGVAFSSMPSLANTYTGLKIEDNGGEIIPWSATSDAAWLTVTPSGATGSDLTLTADPDGLAVDTFYSANVTVTSSNAFVSNSQTVAVGFWVGAAAPNASDTVNEIFDGIITDPIRPYAYVHKGGSQIEVYNVYTAEVAATIASTTISRAGDMAISDDGSDLYVYDVTNQNVGRIDLNTYTDVETLDAGQSEPIEFGRVDGQPFLFSSDGSIIGLESDDAVSISLGFYDKFNGNLDVSRNGEKLCGINSGLSPYSLDCYALKYSYLAGAGLDVTHLGGVAHGSGSNGRDVAVTDDGSKVYAASGAPYVFIRFDTETLQKDQELPADSYPNNVEIGSDGLLYGGVSSWYGPLDAWIYDSNGAEQSSYYLSGYADNILARQLVVSGDATRMIALTEDPKMAFVTVK